MTDYIDFLRAKTRTVQARGPVVLDKESYYRQACRNLQAAHETGQQDLFAPLDYAGIVADIPEAGAGPAETERT